MYNGSNEWNEASTQCAICHKQDLNLRRYGWSYPDDWQNHFGAFCPSAWWEDFPRIRRD